MADQERQPSIVSSRRAAIASLSQTGNGGCPVQVRGRGGPVDALSWERESQAVGLGQVQPYLADGREGRHRVPQAVHAAARSRRLKAARPASAAITASPVSQAMAVQRRPVAGTGPRWVSSAASRSQWLVVMLDPTISTRKDHRI